MEISDLADLFRLSLFFVKQAIATTERCTRFIREDSICGKIKIEHPLWQVEDSGGRASGSVGEIARQS